MAEQTEKDIDATRSQYIPVAVSTRILFFCVAALSNIDPMYQYSLEWFLGIFILSMKMAQVAGGPVASFSCSVLAAEALVG